MLNACTKINMLIIQYELFKMEDDKTIDEMFERFQINLDGLWTSVKSTT